MQRLQYAPAAAQPPASRLVWYEEEEVRPLVEELNELEETAKAAREAQKEAQRPPSLIAGQRVAMEHRQSPFGGAP